MYKPRDARQVLQEIRDIEDVIKECIGDTTDLENELNILDAELGGLEYE